MFENNHELMTMKVRPDTDAGGKAIKRGLSRMKGTGPSGCEPQARHWPKHSVLYFLSHKNSTHVCIRPIWQVWVLSPRDFRNLPEV